MATSRKKPGDPPAEIGVRELKNQASRILRAVQEESAEYVVTVRGKPVAVLRSLTDEDRDRQARAGDRAGARGDGRACGANRRKLAVASAPPWNWSANRGVPDAGD